MRLPTTAPARALRALFMLLLGGPVGAVGAPAVQGRPAGGRAAPAAASPSA